MHPEKISYTPGKRNPEKKLLYFSQKKAVLMFWENGNRKELFTFQKTELSELKKMKNPTLKNFLCFEKWNFSNPRLKYYWGNIAVSSDLLTSPLIFTILLSDVFIVDSICSLHCFFRCFYFTTDFIIVFRVFSFHQVSLPRLFFQVLRFCAVAPWVLWIWKSFFYSQVFFVLYSFPTFGITCFYPGLPGSGSSALKIAGPPTEVPNTKLAHLIVLVTQCSAKGSCL